MKILLVSEYSLYNSIGGTETYVHLLLKHLSIAKLNVVLITQGTQSEDVGIIKQEHDGVIVYFLFRRRYKKVEIKQEKISSTWPEIETILQEERPNIIHVHTHSTFFNFNHFEKLKLFQLPVFFTTHVPGHICSRGDLIKFGRKPCNGKVGNQCIICLFSKGFLTGISGLVRDFYRYPLRVIRSLENSNVTIICVSAWQKQMLLENGFPSNRIQVIRQAIALDELVSKKQLVKPNKIVHHKFRVGYLGRLSYEKGASLLLNIIEKSIQYNEFQFVFAIPFENSNKDDLEKLFQSDAYKLGFVKVMDSISSLNKERFFSEIDCLLIPSFFWETGPIVLLEALAFRKPIVGVRLGGIIEYCEQFPEIISTFAWGDADDAIEKLKSRKNNVSNDLIFEKAYDILLTKEAYFIEKHLHLFQVSLSSS
jgi:glycosyltransferase involved in cell wall biosynthesis